MRLTGGQFLQRAAARDGRGDLSDRLDLFDLFGL